ncbi:hypothetical protein O6H91_12G091300 [Diphasiastrum complanatum]|uniref:Uncharacterized protein n=1 Tax=Diphasiastrum complanatum TaxID=34168 RepID=A0ACC2C5P7_DIPCM|nr:hypothetical protein O6H91_12G091300 [Diphasiastrum complanatum]
MATYIEDHTATLRNLMSNLKDALFILERELLPDKYASRAFRKRSSIDIGKSLHVLKTEIVRRVSKYGKQMRRPEIGIKYTSAELGTQLITSLATDCFYASGLKMGTDAGLPSTNISLNFMEEDPQSGEISQRNRAICCSKDGSGTSNFDNDTKKAASIEDQERTSRNLLSNSKDAIFTLERELLPNRYASKGRNKPLLEWRSRTRISVGAARGLRYLHEESRAGCIIHQDMRPNNILLTHDFEPMVGGFELARWQPDKGFGVETKMQKSFGYLSPEYSLNGQIAVKTDVFSHSGDCNISARLLEV